MKDPSRGARRIPLVVVLTVALVATSGLFASSAQAVSFGGKFKDEGAFALNQPWGVATDELGFVYVVDSRNHRIVKFDPNNRDPVWATLGGFGSGVGQLSYPEGIAVSGDVVYVADTSNHRIQRFTSSGQPLAPIDDEGEFAFAYPSDVDFFNGHLFVTEGGANCRVQIIPISTTGVRQTFGSCGAGNNQFASPAGIEVTSDAIYVADRILGVVKKFNYLGQHVLTIGSKGTGPGQFQNPDGLEVTQTEAEGTTIWVVDSGENSRLSKFTGDGEFVTDVGGTGAPFTFPHGVALDPLATTLYVTDTSGEDPAVVVLFDSEPKVFVAPEESLKRLVRTEGLWYTMLYNQETKTCMVLAKSTVSVPGHPEFKVEEDFKVKDSGDDFKVDVSSKQAKWMKQAEEKNKKVSIDVVVKGNCDEGHKTTTRESYKAS
jgi:DNA-binding beta-propeller fold protein YncE